MASTSQTPSAPHARVSVTLPGPPVPGPSHPTLPGHVSSPQSQPLAGQAGQAPQPMVIIQQAPVCRPTVYTWYQGVQSLVSGATQIIVGCLSIISQAVAIYTQSLNRYRWTDLVFYLPGTGVWAGIVVGGTLHLYIAISGRWQ